MNNKIEKIKITIKTTTYVIHFNKKFSATDTETKTITLQCSSEDILYSSKKNHNKAMHELMHELGHALPFECKDAIDDKMNKVLEIENDPVQQMEEYRAITIEIIHPFLYATLRRIQSAIREEMQT